MTLRKPLIGVFAAVFLLSGLVPSFAFAATTPTLGTAATYGVLASTYTNTVIGTTITGDLGYITGPATTPTVSGTTHANDLAVTAAGTAQGTALAALAAQACTFTFAPGAIDLSTDITHGAAGVYVPGVYCSTGAMDVGGPLTLSGSGTFIFRPVGALTSTAGATITLASASACDVFWTPSQAVTLAANTTFVGTAIADAGITIGSTVNWTGRALSFGGTVSTNVDTITVPTCATPSTGGSSNQAPAGTITVVKVVTNDNGRTSLIEDFPLFMNGTPVVSGETNTFFPAAAYDITETSNLAQYTRTFSGDCDAAGRLNLNAGDAKVCIITNDDIGAPVAVPPVPPLIDVLKVPSPLALPNGPGPVQYTYTLRNIGTVPVTNITMVGDTCFPIVRVSGDTNNDNTLDVNETWVHTCSTSLTETHTNVVTATGWANGISAVDIASATVIVGAPIVPPLIHITKTPSKFALLAGGGVITYTKKVTNPGTVALSNVTLTDSQCSPLKFISGDTNSNTLLESSETWTYTCTKKLTKTTTNTAYVSGTANGMTARDFAVATVVVAAVVPTLPRTGFSPNNISFAWAAGAITLITIATTLMILRKKKNV